MSCDKKLPSVCGRSRLPTFPEGSCGQVHFTGLTDVTIAQGDPFDLEQNVHAYDGNGDEIAYTYTPSSIDTSVPGVYVITYTASGTGTSLKPTMRGDMDIHAAECGNETATGQRTITVVSGCATVCEAITCESTVCC